MNNSVFSPSQCPLLAHCTAQMVNIPEFIVSAAIKNPHYEMWDVYRVAEKT